MKKDKQENTCDHKFIRNPDNNGDMCQKIHMCNYTRFDNPQSETDNMKALFAKHISLAGIRDSYCADMTLKLMFDDVEISSISF